MDVKSGMRIDNVKKEEKTYKRLSLFFGLVLLTFSIKDKNILSGLLGLLMVFYSTYKLEVFLRDDRISYHYNNFVFSQTRDYFFKDLEELVLIKGNVLFLIDGSMAKRVNLDMGNLEEIKDVFRKNKRVKFTVEN